MSKRPIPGTNDPSTVAAGDGGIENGAHMATCEVCGNDYDKTFELIAAGERHIFDSFECAIHRMAPTVNTAARVIGHGAEVSGASSAARTAHERPAAPTRYATAPKRRRTPDRLPPFRSA